MLKAVVDTNIFVSSALGSKNARKIIEVLADNKFTFMSSPYLFNELTHVLKRKNFNFQKTKVDKILTFVKLNAVFVIPKNKISICRDPKDNPILECAVAGEADFIITGDNDLLTLDKFKDISIVKSADFLKVV